MPFPSSRFVLLILIGGATSVSGQDGVSTVRAFREAEAPAILRRYADFLALPNVASDSAGIARNVAWLLDRLVAAGVDTAVLRLPGAPPVVFGRVTVPGATRTLALYAHYDGQPANPEEWLQQRIWDTDEHRSDGLLKGKSAFICVNLCPLSFVPLR